MLVNAKCHSHIKSSGLALLCYPQAIIPNHHSVKVCSAQWQCLGGIYFRCLVTSLKEEAEVTETPEIDANIAVYHRMNAVKMPTASVNTLVCVLLYIVRPVWFGP